MQKGPLCLEAGDSDGISEDPQGFTCVDSKSVPGWQRLAELSLGAVTFHYFNLPLALACCYARFQNPRKSSPISFISAHGYCSGFADSL